MPQISYVEFQENILPLYSGPHVTIQIGNELISPRYSISKALITRQSPYFKAMFSGTFLEGQTQLAILHEEPGIVSSHSFEMLLQYFYTGHVGLVALPAEESITAIIEFVRLADMTGTTGMEENMAASIKDIILQRYKGIREPYQRALDNNTHCVTSAHIESAALLRRGHPVRTVLADAAVEGYLLSGERGHKFSREAEEVAEFALDLLRQVSITMLSVTGSNRVVRFTDPFSGAELIILN